MHENSVNVPVDSAVARTIIATLSTLDATRAIVCVSVMPQWQNVLWQNAGCSDYLQVRKRSSDMPVDWKFEAIDVTTCNCDFSCPCQFNALPTHGDCRAAVGFRIDNGHFGETSLDGVKFVVLAAWPGAIHEGRGQLQLIIDDTASEDQLKAVFALVKGEETEPGATIFNVFSNVIDTYHEPIARPIEIEADIEGRTARISVPGIVEGTGEPIRNPVTGAPHRVRVTLPEGFEYHEAEYASSHVRTGDASIPLQWDQGHAHLARVTWTPQGVVHR